MTNSESWILSYLVNSLWQVPLLFAAGWLAARAVRPLGAIAEHRSWVTVLVLQAIVPALPTLPAGWLSIALSWITRPKGSASSETVSVVLGPGSALGGLHLPAALLTIALMFCVLVTVYFLIRFFWRYTRLASLSRRSRELPLSPSQAESFTRAQEMFGLRDVSVRTTEELAIPVTLGITRSIILLPAALVPALSDSDFRTVLSHELAHIRRRDFARNLAYELLAVPISYHPLLRVTRERIAESREMICDQLAAEHAGVLEYGRSLLRLASLLVVGPPARRLHAIGIFDSHSLERRLMRLKHIPALPSGARRFVLFAACAVLAIATCASAMTLHVKVDAGLAAGINAAANSAHRVEIPADKAQAHVLTKVPPKYPEDAKKARIQGTVKLKAIISKDGTVDHLSVVSGPAKLQKSSLDAVRQWTYKPFLLNGQPTEVETTINVTYSLAK